MHWRTQHVTAARLRERRYDLTVVRVASAARQWDEQDDVKFTGRQVSTAGDFATVIDSGGELDVEIRRRTYEIIQISHRVSLPPEERAEVSQVIWIIGARTEP